MAKKQNEKQSNKSTSVAQGFTGGMISDPNPRYQIKGSYRDALNIRLSNDSGETFSVENILGNKKMFNLNDICQQEADSINLEGILGTRTANKAGVAASGDKFSEIYIDPTSTDINGNQVGEYYPNPSSFSGGVNPFNGTSVTSTSWSTIKNHDASIVGHYSFNTNAVLIIVIPHFGGYADKTQTIFLNIEFDKDLNIISVIDLFICYDSDDSSPRYPDLNMKMDHPVRVEGIVENECISRIFWTDNINPLRSINLKLIGKNRLSPDVLDLTPLHSPSQAVVSKTISGSLPIGQIQYCYKYISSNGGESVMSPLSNLYHTTKHSSSNSQTFYGSMSDNPSVDVSSQGFQVTIKDLDNDFDIIELYSVLHTQNDGPVSLSLVGNKQYSDTSSDVIFYHTHWSGDIESGIESILIDVNTWEICKDISIKDNILFAGNLRTRDNSISEKEWNVKVRRYNIADDNTGGGIGNNTGRITSSDSQIIEYEVDNTTTETVAVSSSLGLTWPDGTPKWRTYKGNSTTTFSGIHYEDEGRTDIQKKQSHEYRYLKDGLTLGAESYEYSENDLGGCRVTFGLQQREIDMQHNVSASPFISAGPIPDVTTDNISDDGAGSNITDNTDTTYTATMGIGGSKDPGIGNIKGYRRGEMYRFGVQIYDKKGRPGNVLWIGDIETPEMNDPLRMLRKDSSDYDPGMPTHDSSGGDSLYSKDLLSTHELCGDHRTSVIFGSTFPCIDVAWFNQTVGPWGNRRTRRYVRDGKFTHLAHPLSIDGTFHTISAVNLNAETAGDTGAGIPIIAAYTNPNGSWTDTTESGWYSANWVQQSSNIDTTHYTIKQIPYRYEHSARDNAHHALDLFVNFEFRIPQNVRDKISGFRVVRAERQESDKSILQQGILNQTVAYGHNNPTQGYHQSLRIADEDSEEEGLITRVGSETRHGPFDSVLNGYIGLAENSNIAFVSDTSSTQFNLLPDAAYSDDDIYAFNDFEEAINRPDPLSPFFGWDTGVDYGNFGTPGNDTPKRRHSSYFGCYEVMPNTLDRWGSSLSNQIDYGISNPPHWSRGACNHAIQGSVFTLDSPDSAFGYSSYSFRTGDTVRVDAIMKLVHEYNTTSNATSSSALTTATGQSHDNDAFGVLNHTGNNIGPAVSSLPFQSSDRHAVQTSGSFTWNAQNQNHTSHEALKYCKKIAIGDTTDGYGALIGKYYIYDTYYGIGMSIDGGAGYAKGSHDNLVMNTKDNSWNAGDPYTPRDTKYKISQHHDIYHHKILNARELWPGEIVGKSWFKDGVLMIDKGDKGFITTGAGYATNVMNGFSNNTLGFYSGGSVQTHWQPQKWSGGTSFLFAGIKNCIHHTSPTNMTPHDRTYDTISTVQSGLKTILIQIDGDGEGGEKRGLLNPRALSEVLEHRHWGTGGTGPQDYYLNQGILSNEKIGRGGAFGTSGTFANTNATGDWGGPSYIPYKFLCSIVRNTIPYGGSGINAIQQTRYIPAGNFHPIKKDIGGNSEENHLSQVFGGDTFINFYSHQKTSCEHEKRSYARWQVFPVESDVNTDMRMGYHLNVGNTNIGDVLDDETEAVNHNDWEYNDVYSQENNLKSAVSIDETKTCKSLELPYEIAYSETKISGEPTDSFKVFKYNSFHDMESQYGEIIRLKNWKNDLYVLQESGMSKLLVNPISMLSDELGSTLYTGTGETVENHLYISTRYGTRNMDSVVSSETSLYYIDNTYGKLLQYTGESLKIISDDLGQKDSFNISIKGMGHLDSKVKIDRNFICDNSLKFNGITSIFDYKNNELIITTHSSELNNKGERDVREIGSGENRTYTPNTYSRTIVYSESLNAFTSYYSVTPKKWMNIGGFVASTESMTYLDDSTNNFNDNHLSLWKWDEQIYNYKTVFFDENIVPSNIAESSITKVISEMPSVSKVFDNSQIIMTPNTKTQLPNSFAEFETEIIASDNININANTAAKYKEGILRFPLRSTGPRQRGTYIKIKYSTHSTNKFNIFAILAKYRKSYQ